MLSELKKLAADFSANPLVRGREMRELLEESPPEFCSAALGMFESDVSERVQRYLVALLWTNNMLISCLADPLTPDKKAEDIAALARRVDPQLPAKLIGFVLEETEAQRPVSVERILGILRSMSDASNFRSLLTPLLRHPDARIRSKVALMAGEGNRNLTWFARRMEEDDPRVRANAIESGAMAVNDDLRPVFRAAALDSNNRVVGNALIALYRLGDSDAIGSLYDLTSSPEANFRATAVWAMGETGDARFQPLLTRIATDPNGTIKTATLRALRKLRGRDSVETQPLGVHIVGEPCASEGILKIPFAVSSHGKPLPGIAATTVRVKLNGELQYRYTVTEQESARHMAAAFLLPRGAEQQPEETQLYRNALEKCFEQRDPADRWMFSGYSGSVGPGTSGRPETLFGVRIDTTEKSNIRCVTNLTELREAIDSREPVKSQDVSSAFLGLCQELRLSRGSTHLFLFHPDTAPPIDTGSLARAAQEARIAVHALCAAPATRIREICNATGGSYATGEEIPEMLSAFYRGVSHRYIAHVPTIGPVSQAQVAVRTQESYGESSIMQLSS